MGGCNWARVEGVCRIESSLVKVKVGIVVKSGEEEVEFLEKKTSRYIGIDNCNYAG